MAECIIARGGSYGGGSNEPPIIADKHTILVTVRDSAGDILSGTSVDCYDGGLWYNYHTNDKGQVLFVTNSGTAYISAQNFSRNEAYKFLDQDSIIDYQVDAPVGLSSVVNLNLTYRNNQEFTSMSSDIYESNTPIMYDGNYKVRVANYANLFLGGAGGGAAGSMGRSKGANDTYWLTAGGGGGGGGITIANNINLNKSITYTGFVGIGGLGGDWSNGSPHTFSGNAGGSSSFFGFIANGGGGGGFDTFIETEICYNASGGSAGTGTYGGGKGGNSGKNGQASGYSNWGGGGGGGFYQGYGRGGNGGIGPNNYEHKPQTYGNSGTNGICIIQYYHY